MRHTKNTPTAVVLWTLSILLLFSFNASAIVWYNSSLIIIETNGEGRVSSSLNHTQIDGAGYFLKSYSDILLFLQKVELAETGIADYSQLQGILEDAISNLRLTKEYYWSLKAQLETMPKNRNVAMALALFDYEAYSRRHKLNPSIFQDVKSFLVKGDVEGLYGKSLASIDRMLSIAKRIHGRVLMEQKPELEDLWQLDEVCSQTLRTGQYTARVFLAIQNQ